MSRKALYALALCAALLSGMSAVVYFQSERWHTFYCTAVLPAARWSPKVVAFRECSNVRHTVIVDSFENVREERPEEYPGWTVLTPDDKSREARFRVKLLRDRAEAVIFPRASGADSGVELFELLDSSRRKLFGMAGRNGAWTDVASQYNVNLGCVFDGYKPQDFGVVLEFALKGPWAQVWCKNGAVFF
ncbi:hypothetical protein [Fundidesulfovibrio agrisoli]|uniref:hypothetical protein n=1 Tax=Fundidesulfovibrio agrisoli TaxID=2922717 RepID=UPI001FAB6B39|nr:hypothetical protein [Fundidesulfovibrio agrisoli]